MLDTFQSIKATPSGNNAKGAIITEKKGYNDYYQNTLQDSYHKEVSDSEYARIRTSILNNYCISHTHTA